MRNRRSKNKLSWGQWQMAEEEDGARPGCVLDHFYSTSAAPGTILGFYRSAKIIEQSLPALTTIQVTRLHKSPSMPEDSVAWRRIICIWVGLWDHAFLFWIVTLQGWVGCGNLEWAFNWRNSEKILESEHTLSLALPPQPSHSWRLAGKFSVAPMVKGLKRSVKLSLTTLQP